MTVSTSSPKRRPQTPTMTPEDARSFGRFSIQNATILYEAAVKRGCTCQPYEDWFTYDRWGALGFQVRKGEHGERLACFAPITSKDENGEIQVVGKRPWSSAVFCRCQVDPKGERK